MYIFTIKPSIYKNQLVINSERLPLENATAIYMKMNLKTFFGMDTWKKDVEVGVRYLTFYENVYTLAFL